MTMQSENATPAETRGIFTRLSARGYTQIRHVFVQLPDRELSRVSVVGPMLHGRKHRALLLYLLLLTAWPWLRDRREPLEADVWIRALTASDLSDTSSATTWSASTLSRAWTDLTELNLVVKKREGRLLRVTPRREDAGAEYELPGGRSDRWNAYFALPDAFWSEGWFAKLSLPALVMLLVVAKETNAKDEAWLTYENCDEWYGVKTKSAQKGITELIKHGLLDCRSEPIKAPLSPTGQTTRSWYSLTGDFGHPARAAVQKQSAKETRNRRARLTSLHSQEVAKES